MDYSVEHEQGFVKQLLAASVVKNMSRGEFVYHSAEPPAGLYYVESGLVGLIKGTAKGQEHLLRIFKPKQFFGHRSLFADEPYHASARCIENCTLRFCIKSDVIRVFDENPSGYYYLSRALAKELRRAEIRSVIISDSEVVQRVAATIVLFKSLYPQHLWTRTEIANFCASRTPTVIKALGKLEDRGLIRQVGRRIEILDSDRLLSIVS